MKILDNIMSILMIIGGVLLCGIRNTEFDLSPLGIVFIVLGFIMIGWTIIDNIVAKVIGSSNREINVIINIPKKEKAVEKEKEPDMVENWELAIDPITKLVQDELFGKENDDDNEKKG